MKSYKPVKCNSLGTHWRDIVDNKGKLFAVQVPTDIAEAFCAEPGRFPNVETPIEFLRRDLLDMIWAHSVLPAADERERGAGVKIITQGKIAEKAFRTTCNKCETVFECVKSDGEFVTDSRDGDAIVVKCPVCKNEIWIDVALFR